MLLGIALLMVGQAAAREPGKVPEIRSVCQAVEVISPASPKKSRQARVPRFSPVRDRDLDISTAVRSGPGAHTLYFKVFTPRGHLYQTLTTPFVTPAPVKGQMTNAAGQVREVSVTLPVAGTAIMTSGLYGQWRAEAWIDAGSTPCASPKQFVITE